MLRSRYLPRRWRGAGRGLALGLGLAVLLGSPAAALPAPWAPDAVRGRAREVVARGKYQDSLDYAAEEAGGLPRPRAFEASPEGRRGRPVAPAFGAIAAWTLYILLGAVLVLAGVWIATAVLDRGGPAERPLAPAPLAAPEPRTTGESRPSPGDQDPEGLLRRAEELAAAGRHGEAAHALLLGAIRGLSLELGTPQASLTSRELARHFRLDGERRSAFGDMVLAVERTLFGARPADASVYERCRERLLAVLPGGRA